MKSSHFHTFEVPGSGRAFFRTLSTAAIALSAGLVGLRADTWTGGTGDWFTAGNWSAGVPNNTDNPLINNGGVAQISTTAASIGGLALGAGSLVVQSGGSLNVGGGNGFNIGSTGHDNNPVTAPTYSSFLTIQGGATVSVSGGSLISVGLNATGHVTVDGTGSTWSNTGSLDVGGGFQGGFLTIQNGGAVSSAGGQIAAGSTVTIGAGSSWTAGASGVTASGGGVAGSLVLSGGTLTASFLNFNSTGGTLSGYGSVSGNIAAGVSGTNFDLVLGSTLEVGGTFNANNFALSVANSNSLSLNSAQTFNLLTDLSSNPKSLSNAFASVSLPTLASGLSWDTSQLYSAGKLSITGTAIPEHSTSAAAFGAFALAWGFYYRRSRLRGQKPSLAH